MLTIFNLKRIVSKGKVNVCGCCNFSNKVHHLAISNKKVKFAAVSIDPPREVAIKYPGTCYKYTDDKVLWQKANLFNTDMSN